MKHQTSEQCAVCASTIQLDTFQLVVDVDHESGSDGCHEDCPACAAEAAGKITLCGDCAEDAHRELGMKLDALDLSAAKFKRLSEWAKALRWREATENMLTAEVEGDNSLALYHSKEGVTLQLFDGQCGELTPAKVYASIEAAKDGAAAFLAEWLPKVIQPKPAKPTMTQEEFSEWLEIIVGRMTTAQILSYGDVYSLLAEKLNNEVIEAWEKSRS